MKRTLRTSVAYYHHPNLTDSDVIHLLVRLLHELEAEEGFA